MSVESRGRMDQDGRCSLSVCVMRTEFVNGWVAKVAYESGQCGSVRAGPLSNEARRVSSLGVPGRAYAQRRVPTRTSQDVMPEMIVSNASERTLPLGRESAAKGCPSSMQSETRAGHVVTGPGPLSSFVLLGHGLPSGREW